MIRCAKVGYIGNMVSTSLITAVWRVVSTFGWSLITSSITHSSDFLKGRVTGCRYKERSDMTHDMSLCDVDIGAADEDEDEIGGIVMSPVL